jgi:hypothetical protein
MDCLLIGVETDIRTGEETVRHDFTNRENVCIAWVGQKIPNLMRQVFKIKKTHRRDVPDCYIDKNDKSRFYIETTLLCSNT